MNISKLACVFAYIKNIHSVQNLLVGCSTGTDPVTDSVTLGSVTKVMESGMKPQNPEKMLGQLHIPDRT